MGTDVGGMKVTQTQEQTSMLRGICFVLLKLSGSQQAGKATSRLSRPRKPRSPSRAQNSPQEPSSHFTVTVDPGSVAFTDCGGHMIIQSIHKGA